MSQKRWTPLGPLTAFPRHPFKEALKGKRN